MALTGSHSGCQWQPEAATQYGRVAAPVAVALVVPMALSDNGPGSQAATRPWPATPGPSLSRTRTPGQAMSSPATLSPTPKVVPNLTASARLRDTVSGSLSES